MCVGVRFEGVAYLPVYLEVRRQKIECRNKMWKVNNEKRKVEIEVEGKSKK